VKEIISRNVEKFLKIEEKEDGKYHYCPHCGQLVVVTHKDVEYSMVTSCDHFQWNEITVTLYSIYMKLIDKSSIMTIFDDISVLFLVPTS